MSIDDVDKFIPQDHGEFVDALMKKFVCRVPQGEREIFDEYMTGMIQALNYPEGRSGSSL